MVGIEPTRGYPKRILSPQCLPFRHAGRLRSNEILGATADRKATQVPRSVGRIANPSYVQPVQSVNPVTNGYDPGAQSWPKIIFEEYFSSTIRPKTYDRFTRHPI